MESRGEGRIRNESEFRPSSLVYKPPNNFLGILLEYFGFLFILQYKNWKPETNTKNGAIPKSLMSRMIYTEKKT